jgi:hypothetical protein
MNEASTPFDLAGGVPQWRMSRSRSCARVAVAGQQAKHIRVASEAAIAARAVAGLP